MDTEIFRDLKQLDERLQKATQLLRACIDLFDKNYCNKVRRKETFSWPYSVHRPPDPIDPPRHIKSIRIIKGKTADIYWPDYARAFPHTPHLSPSTTALCGWAVYRLSRRGGEVAKRLGEDAAEAAKRLASLPAARLKSETFKVVGEIFLHAQVLRFLASQAHYKGKLFSHVFKRVRDAVNNPGGDLHPFLLHYCVLAWEQVRGPALTLADCVLNICDIADETAKLEADSKKRGSKKQVLKRLIHSLALTSQLRDALESFATVVHEITPQSVKSKQLDRLAANTGTVIDEITDAITDDSQDATKDPLALLQDLINRSLRHSGTVLRTLPQEISKLKPQAPPLVQTDELRKAAADIKAHPWYSETFRERLVNEVVRQISYASSSEDSRLDIGALAYSLAAVIHSDALHLPRTLARKALSIIFEHQRGGRWNEIQPMARTAVGFVHYPLNIEIANAVLATLRDDLSADAPTLWKHLDDVMDWVVTTENKVGRHRGWCSEHDYAPDRIDLWATAQMAQFLLDYREIRSGLVIRSAIDRAGIVTVDPDSVGTTWKKLQASDLEGDLDEQIKNKLRDKFVKPHQRSEKTRSSSVLLYGPPGTSKTSIMEALANKLQWRFLQITPADFLSAGGEQVEARATLLFEILRRAKNLIVLFDEVDEFLLDREVEVRPEGIFRFMTTSMLPKLQSLKSQGSLIFGIATNYKERLDKAITRLGRVDHDWAVLPPDFTSRIVLIRTFGNEIDPKDIRTLAANTPFFSFLELKKVALENLKMPIDPWKVVRHPTASPEAYTNRPGLAEEFPSLLKAQITDFAARLANPDIRKKLKIQLEEFQTTKKLRVTAASETVVAVDEAIKRLT